MRRSCSLFFLLLLAVTGNTGLAYASGRQDPKPQEWPEAAKRVASNDEDNQAIEGLADLPFLGRPITTIEFRGNRAFTSESLLSNFKYVKIGARYGAKAKARLAVELDRLRVLVYVDNGYLQARFKTPELENTTTGVKISIPVEEGVLYRAGEVKILDAKHFPSDEVLETLGLKKGDVIRGYTTVNQGVERLKKKYLEEGYIQFQVDFVPTFHAPAPDFQEAIADVDYSVEEGKRYSINKIIISADESLNKQEIRTRLLLREGEVFKQSRFEQSLEQVNQFLTRFGVYEKLLEYDVEMNTNEATDQVDLIFKIKKEFPKSLRR